VFFLNLKNFIFQKLKNVDFLGEFIIFISEAVNFAKPNGKEVLQIDGFLAHFW